MRTEQSGKKILGYGTQPTPPSITIAILFCAPEVTVGLLYLFSYIIVLIPRPIADCLWFFRAVGMIAAIGSLVVYADGGQKSVRPWYVKLALLVNISGLAISTFSILRVVNLMLQLNHR